ncbi:hypothetical protein TNIN_373031 [Trichonephila inaurata madagascariensis]|uniref:Uncharacterized protein n=1 Tax=Trichonephila inaurata madagascariensis TaxID=2747483 RepID=A0A8X6YFP1_9ARAC|nr:hypothetical protein TNIN_373031 [Trichonephila inaurata madagascariensis]
MSRLITRGEESRQLARIRTFEAQHRDKTRYDARHRSVSYQPGELVRVFTPVMKVEAQKRILTNATEKLPSNAPVGATYNVGTDKNDTALDSPREIVPYRRPLMRSRKRNVKEL